MTAEPLFQSQGPVVFLGQPGAFPEDAELRGFLQQVLPSNGLYGWMARKNGVVVGHGLFRDINELIATLWIHHLQGHDVYFNLATFKDLAGVIEDDGERHLRSQGNARVRRQLGLDIDTRISHDKAHYADQEAAKAAVERMCEAEQMPLPTFVNSGGGLHGHWSFERDLTQDEWRPYAGALQAASKAHGIPADHQVTINFVGVLRPVATRHVKTGNTVKVMGALRGPHPWSAFDHLVKKYPAESRKRSDRSQPSAVTAQGGGQAPAGKASSTPEPFAETLENVAAFLTALRFTDPTYYWGKTENYPDVDLAKAGWKGLPPAWFAGLAAIKSLPWRQATKEAIAISWSGTTKCDNYAGDDGVIRKLNDIGKKDGGITYKAVLKWARIRGWNGRPDPEIRAALIAPQTTPKGPNGSASPVAGTQPEAQATPTPQANGAPVAGGTAQPRDTAVGPTAVSLDDAQYQAKVDAAVKELAALPPVLYERQREKAADLLGMRKSTLDRLVKTAQESGEGEGQGQALKLFEPEPWPHPVDGAELVRELRQAVLRFVVMSADDALVTALWVVHTYTFDIFVCPPRLGISSPQKRCGKTTLLDVLACLVRRPLLAANLTAASVFRSIELYHPVLLLDEADNLWRKGASDVNQDLLAVLNSGHRHGGQVLRVAGEDLEPRVFSTHAPAAVATIGQPPETLQDRSVGIHLKRKHAGQKTESLRHEQKEELRQLARKCQRWTNDRRDNLARRRPEMPPALTNRVADCWESLLAIADECTPQWGDAARRIAVKAATASGQDEKENVALMVLNDIRDVFLVNGTDRLASFQIEQALNQREDRPWADWSRLTILRVAQRTYLSVRPESS